MTKLIEQINQKFYDEMFCRYLDEGKDVTEASDLADKDLSYVVNSLASGRKDNSL